jgi:6-phosphogluconate dehydrogenase (decarboxylating)
VEDGIGHFVKMVHNRIDYGDMQLICEAYHLMKDTLGMSKIFEDEDKNGEGVALLLAEDSLIGGTRRHLQDASAGRIRRTHL